jgi:Zn-dependent M28 family amino/carboxypeptidase
MAAQAGAVGLIELSVPGRPGARSSALASYSKTPVVDWIASSGQTGDKGLLSMAIAVSPAVGESLFTGSRMTFDQVATLARKGGKLPAFDLASRMGVQSQTVFEDFTSPQVIGIMPGSDAQLAAEHIVLMGHLDHLGIKADAKRGEDRIYNGALDNASGIATMIEAARKFAEPGQRTRRSLMFMANAGEERGLLGADYFAAHPTVPTSRIVGLVNLDMPVLLYDFADVIAFGAEHSTIARSAATAGSSMGVAIAPDPMPQESLFVRSDHYRFVTRGVPSIFLMTGHANGGKKAWERFLANNYHKPNDDLNQPINWNAGARFAEINFRIAKALADAPQRPMWYRGDYFGDRYAPWQPKAAK